VTGHLGDAQFRRRRQIGVSRHVQPYATRRARDRLAAVQMAVADYGAKVKGQAVE